MIRAAALYSRVSDDKGGQSRSVAEQTEAGRGAAREHGWTRTEYAETRSASRFATRDRPEWDRLQQDIISGKFAVVILWEPSRGGRELEAWAAFLNVCRAAGCSVYVTSHNQLYDLHRARDWRSLAEDGVDSAYESDKTSMRVRRAYQAAYADGRPMGRVPFGFLRRSDPVTGRVARIADPPAAALVAALIGRIAAGEAVSRIVRDLAARSITGPTGRPWSRSSVTSLVRVCYLGKRRVGGQLVDADWPAIVPEDVFWQARAVLDNPERRDQAVRRGGSPRPGSCKWLLSYISQCAVCSSPLSVSSRAAGPQYRCSGRHSHAYVSVALMDQWVSAAIVAWCSKPAIYAELTRVDDADSALARGDALAERDRLAGLEAQCAAGEISGSSFARIAALVEARIAELDRLAESSGISPVLRGLLQGAESPDDREDIIRACFDSMPLTAKRRVISTLCEISLSPVGEFAADNPWRVSIRWR